MWNGDTPIDSQWRKIYLFYALVTTLYPAILTLQLANTTLYQRKKKYSGNKNVLIVLFRGRTNSLRNV